MKQTFIRRVKEKIKNDYSFLLPIVGRPYAMLRDWRLRLITWQVQYDEPGLIVEAAADFLHDEKYLRSIETAMRDCGRNYLDRGGNWRMYTGCWAANHATKLEGDFVECGVDRGMMSRTQVEYTGFKNLAKKFYLVDLFGVGRDKSLLSKEELKIENRPGGGYDHSYEETKHAFATIPNVEVIKGSVPSALASLPIKKVAYIHIDMNSVAPEIAAAEYFWDKMVPGGIMLLCDYNIFGRKPQREAFNEWARSKGVSVLALPSTQGMILKP